MKKEVILKEFLITETEDFVYNKDTKTFEKYKEKAFDYPETLFHPVKEIHTTEDMYLECYVTECFGGGRTWTDTIKKSVLMPEEVRRF